MSLRYASFIDANFFACLLMKNYTVWYKVNFHSWDYSPEVPDYFDFRIFRRQMKGMLLYLISMYQTSLQTSH